jgi:hypothetical protein
LEIAYEHAPDMKTVIKAIGLTFKQAKTLEKRTGVGFSKPIRKFWGMRPMPHYLEWFIEAHKKRRQRDYTSHSPPPPNLRRRGDLSQGRSDGECGFRGRRSEVRPERKVNNAIQHS